MQDVTEKSLNRKLKRLRSIPADDAFYNEYEKVLASLTTPELIRLLTGLGW